MYTIAIFERIFYCFQVFVIILFVNVFLTLARAQYGSPVGNSNPGYGGTGTAVPSGDYGQIKNPGGLPSGPSGSDGNSEVSFIFIS